MSAPNPKTMSEEERATHLMSAQKKALALFQTIEENLIKPSVTDLEMTQQIHALGAELHGVRTDWHKRVVRSGIGTLKLYAEALADRVIQNDDILFVDLGPVFEEWEADVGRMYVVGDDPEKIKIRDALEPVWNETKRRYKEKADTITGEELFDIAVQVSKEYGYEFAGEHAGHPVGAFPHKQISDDKIIDYIKPGNGTALNRLGRKDGKKIHWILEIHLCHPSGEYGAFFEQLLTVG